MSFRMMRALLLGVSAKELDSTYQVDDSYSYYYLGEVSSTDSAECHRKRHLSKVRDATNKKLSSFDVT